jgi:hypothetical protein
LLLYNDLEIAKSVEDSTWAGERPDSWESLVMLSWEKLEPKVEASLAVSVGLREANSLANPVIWRFGIELSIPRPWF